jgi:G3E family GTPase
MAAYAELIPVNVITGFLGSGKTTLLQRLLRSPRMARTAVLINEFGEVGLDHLLVRPVDESMVLLQSGCICCTIRDDLNAALRDLLGKRQRKEIPQFDRVVIETTGLADPAPILYTLFAEPVLRHHFRLGNVITTVDAVNADRHVTRNVEGVKQVAVADHLVLTKTDIADAAATEQARRILARVNPSARKFDACTDAIDAHTLLRSDLYDPATKSAAVQGWFQEESLRDSNDSAETQEHHAPHRTSRHDHQISSFSLMFDGSLDWTAFGIWLTMLLNRHGENLLRVKGILNVAGMDTPIVINGVQHLVHPPVHLDSWPGPDRRSHIVFITRNMDQERMGRSLAAFNHLSTEAVPA